jgi:N-acetylmuramoyl-L-alanine amidase
MKRKAFLLLPALIAAIAFSILWGDDDMPSRGPAAPFASVIIDPGHGGISPGALQGPLCEDEINYDIALRLYNQLKEKGKPVFITVKDRGFPRPADALSCDRSEALSNGREVTLRGRIALIRELDPAGKALVVSIHINSLPAAMRGFSLYYPVDREGRKRESLAVARSLSRSLAAGNVGPLSLDLKVFTWRFNPLRSRIYRWNFVPAVFSATGNRAVVLCELGNIRNAEDRQNLVSPRYRELLARRLSQALLPAVR